MKSAAFIAGSLLTVGVASPALADSEANAVVKNSPGLISGNNVQVPIHVPINVCGNTVNVIALLNPAFGNECVNDSGKPDKPSKPKPKPSKPKPGKGKPASDNKPGQAKPSGKERPDNGNHSGGPSRHQHKAPVDVKPAGNAHIAPSMDKPAAQPARVLPAAHVPPTLADTGSGEQLGAAAAISVALLGGGVLMLRRGRSSQV